MSDETAVVFERAAQMFAVLSKPLRVRTIRALGQGEMNAVPCRLQAGRHPHGCELTTQDKEFE
jgi:hypothetical protein